MKILIEEHKYPASLVRDTLEGLTSFRDNEGSVSIEYVGYYYNPKLKDLGDGVTATIEIKKNLCLAIVSLMIS